MRRREFIAGLGGAVRVRRIMAELIQSEAAVDSSSASKPLASDDASGPVSPGRTRRADNIFYLSIRWVFSFLLLLTALLTPFSRVRFESQHLPKTHHSVPA